MTRDERGQTTLLIVGFATVLMFAVAVVVDASAAFLQRQGLDSLADGAALYAADLGSAGVYTEGIPEDRLLQQAEEVRAAALAYLDLVGAHEKYPGIEPSVRVDPAGRSVTVTLRAPLDLPLTMPGAPDSTLVGASGTAAVEVQTGE